MRLPKPALLLALLMGTATFTVAAQNERIALESRTISVVKIIRSIEAQTNLKFAFSHQTLDTARMIHVKSISLTVTEALDGMIQGKNLKYVIQGRYVAFVPQQAPKRPQVYNPQPTSEVFQAPDEPSPAPVLRPEPAPIVAEKPVVVAPPVETVSYPEPYSAYTDISSSPGLEKSLPRFAIKTNLLYGGVALAPNLAFEFATGPKQTIALSGSYNGWRRDDNNLNDTKQLVHSIFKAEYRWWMCERFNGHFFGAHALYSRYHISGEDVPLLFDKENRYNGYGMGIGASYGYNLSIGKRWGLEFSVGLGAAYLKYDKFDCAVCDSEAVKSDKWYFGPTQAAVTLVFNFK